MPKRKVHSCTTTANTLAKLAIRRRRATRHTPLEASSNFRITAIRCAIATSGSARSKTTTSVTIVSAPDSRLQQRIYERLCLTGAIVVGVVSVPTNILQGLPWIVTLLAALFGALSLGFYLASRRGYWYPAAYLGLMLVVINSIWFPNGGVLGSTPYFLLPAAGYAVIFFRGGARAAWVSGIALDAAEKLEGHHHAAGYASVIVRGGEGPGAWKWHPAGEAAATIDPGNQPMELVEIEPR